MITAINWPGIWILVWGIIFNINLASAKLVQINVRESRDFGIKIGILPPENQVKDQHIIETIRLIQEDLNYSGQFKVLNLNWPELGISGDRVIDPKHTDFNLLKQTGLEFLLKISVYPKNSASQLIIHLQLIDLYKPLDPVVFNQEIIKHPTETSRKLAHNLAGMIFEHLTGIPSFFSKQIAYIRTENLGQANPKYSLNIADFDGFHEQTILKTSYPIMSPSWSAELDKIAFVSFCNHRANVSVINIHTKKISILAKYPGINGAPAWSPRGDKLALVLSKDGSPSIYILDLASKALDRITFGCSIDTEPCWSKTGEELFFTSTRGGKPQIYKVNLITKKVNRITFKGEYNSTPSLTPDNRHMVMLHCNKNCSKKEGKFIVAVQTLGTSQVKALTCSGVEESPKVAPNGVLVIYSTKNQQSGNKVLAGVAIEGHCNNYLSIMGNGSMKDPIWSP